MDLWYFWQNISRRVVRNFLKNISPSNLFQILCRLKYFIKIIRMLLASVSINISNQLLKSIKISNENITKTYKVSISTSNEGQPCSRLKTPGSNPTPGKWESSQWLWVWRWFYLGTLVSSNSWFVTIQPLYGRNSEDCTEIQINI